MALSQAGVTLAVNYASKQMLSECWLVKLIRETFTQKPRKKLVKGNIQPGSNSVPACDIYKWDRRTEVQNSVTHRREKCVPPPSLKLSHSGEHEDHCDGSSVVQAPLMLQGLGHAHALQKENAFSPVYQYKLFNFSTNPRNGKTPYHSFLFILILKITNMNISNVNMVFRYLTLEKLLLLSTLMSE